VLVNTFATLRRSRDYPAGLSDRVRTLIACEVSAGNRYIRLAHDLEESPPVRRPLAA